VTLFHDLMQQILYS